MIKTKLNSPATYFGLPWALLSLLFLFNPDYTLFDLLPDFIAYVLLTLSLRKLRDLNSYFDTAAEKFSKLIIVSVFKYLAFFAVTLLLDDREGPTMTLLLLFCFTVGELLLIIPAWKAFFDGFAFEGFAYGDIEGKTVLTDKIRSATLFFFVLKEVLTLLPEFSVLAASEYIDRGVKWDEFTGLFRTCALLIISAAGIIWLIRTARFVIKTMKNSELLEAEKEKYIANVLIRTGLFDKRRISLLMILLLIIAIFSTDFRMDGINLLPDFMCGFFCLLFFLLAKKYSPCRKLGIILSALHIPLSGAAWFLSIKFLDDYNITKVMRIPETYAAFWKYYPVIICETAVLAGIIICLLITCVKIIREHCGYIPDSSSDALSENKLAEIRKALNKRLIITGALFFITALASNLCDLVAAYSSNNAGDYFWIVSFLLSLLCIWLVYKIGSLIKNQTESRYMLS